MKIAVLVEGETERAFKAALLAFLRPRCQHGMPKLSFHLYDGRIPKGEKLRRTVKNLLSGPRAADHVIALTDVYTGQVPCDFTDAAGAKRKMREWVGDESRFHPHAAQYDFEAWLLPFWPTIQELAGHNRTAPAANPETVNHDNPPSKRLGELFAAGKTGRKYVKPRDAARILRDNDLSRAVERCTELKAFINTILRLAETAPVR